MSSSTGWTWTAPEPRRARAGAVAAATALALLAAPLQATAGGGSRTVLLTTSGSTSLSSLADRVVELGGRILSSLDVADTLVVELPVGAPSPAGAAVVPDVAMQVDSAATALPEGQEQTHLGTIGATGDDSLGVGVRVALVDTGVADHPDLAGHVDNPSGDGYGHGTFMAGLIASVAPGASILDVKVAADDGTTSLSQVLEGLQTVADANTNDADDDDVDVVNLSLSTDSPLPPSFDPLSRALDRLWLSGVTVVVSAGNDGPRRGTVTSPGDNPLLLTVGALDEKGTATRKDDSVADFSSRGMTFGGMKPDLVAPGVSLLSTGAEDSEAAQADSYADGYMRGTGTSMAAAVTSGAVAAVLSEKEALNPDGVKDLLTSTTYASRKLEPRDGAGNGALDLAAAMAAAGHADPGAPGTTPDDPDASPEDTAAWKAFAAAWEAAVSQDGEDVPDALMAAWRELSPLTRVWAARAWSMAVVLNSLDLDEETFDARAWSARAWSAEEWLARAWSARAWSARAWSFEEWLARAWSARAWSDEEWLARAWSARAWSADDWAARAWSARAWSARAWSARAWSARAWSARAWSARAWSARAWSARAWSARAWSARAWSARAWSDEEWAARAWSARAWSDFMWEARAWSARAWSARAWSLDAWGG